MQNTIRWGIIGCGDVCEIKSGPALQKAAGSELVAVMRRDAAKAADFARRHGVGFSTDNAHHIIENPEVDAVYIATPPGTHLEYALQVCKAKKPCYVEKPMARSVFESRAMLEAFDLASVPLFVAFYRRGLSRFQTVKRLLDEAQIGTLTGVSYKYCSPLSGALEARLSWRLDASEAGAGLFYDLGSHLLDLFDFWFGPLQNVSGIARNVASPDYAVEDTVSMSFEAAGVPASASWNFASFERTDLIEIFGTQGKISLSCFSGDEVKLQTERGVQIFEGALPPHVHQGLVQTVVDELRGQGRALSTGKTALRTMEVMDTVLSTYYGGRDDDFWNRPQSWPGREKEHSREIL